MEQKINEMEKEYYYLKKGEIIRHGDEVEMSYKYNSPPKWVKTNCAGGVAPDPRFISHRKYRRKLPSTTINQK